MANLKMGEICKEFHCHRCCIETEMAISNEDAQRISKETHLPIYLFSYHTRGFRVLRNIRRNNKRVCFFLDEKGLCKIYNIRPQGCRFYPIIWDLEKNQSIIDDYCPYHKKFEENKPLIEKQLKLFVEKLIDEK